MRSACSDGGVDMIHACPFLQGVEQQADQILEG